MCLLIRQLKRDRLIHVLIVFFSWLVLFDLHAQGLFESALQEPLQGNIASPGYELNGFIRGGFFGGVNPATDLAESKSLYGESAIKLRVRCGETGSAYTDFLIRKDMLSENSDPKLVLREAWVTASRGAWDVTFGQQIVVWGRADGYNPTNKITPMNLLSFSPDEDDRRDSNVLVRVAGHKGAWGLETLWVPVYQASVLPFARVALPAGLSWGEARQPSSALKNGAVAMKLKYEGAALDGSISCLPGYLPMPGLRADMSDGGAAIFTAPSKAVMVGADFSSTIGALGSRGEC